MAHSQHLFRAFTTASGNVVLADMTDNTGYIFKESEVHGVYSLTIVKDAAGMVLANIPESYTETPPADVMGVIVSNIIASGDPKDAAIARLLSEQTYDQTDILTGG